MAKRLRVKRRKQKRDRVTEHKKAPKIQSHKIAVGRSKKMKKRKLNRAR